jgi:hypothetical protein
MRFCNRRIKLDINIYHAALIFCSCSGLLAGKSSSSILSWAKFIHELNYLRDVLQYNKNLFHVFVKNIPHLHLKLGVTSIRILCGNCWQQILIHPNLLKIGRWSAFVTAAGSFVVGLFRIWPQGARNKYHAWICYHVTPWFDASLIRIWLSNYLLMARICC